MCDTQFKVHPYRKEAATFCSHSCAMKHLWKTGALIGRPLTEKHKRKISEANSGSKNHFFGRLHSEESKQKMSDGHKHNPSQYWKNKHRSEETRQKTSESLKGRKLAESTKQKISKSLIGRFAGKKNPFYGGHHTEESKAKLSEAHRGKQNPFFGRRHSIETRKKMSEHHVGMTGKKHSPETIRKIIEGNRSGLTKNTSIEITIQNELNSRGVNYQTHLPVCGVCVPDIVFPERRVAVFADGDYWHSKEFKNGMAWKKDRNQDKVLGENGWRVFRFWGHELRRDVKGCVDKLLNNWDTRLGDDPLE